MRHEAFDIAVRPGRILTERLELCERPRQIGPRCRERGCSLIARLLGRPRRLEGLPNVVRLHAPVVLGGRVERFSSALLARRRRLGLREPR